MNNWLGKSVWPDPYFNGAMDEFRIYDVALPASLVLTNYQNGPDGLAIAPPTTTADAAGQGGPGGRGGGPRQP